MVQESYDKVKQAAKNKKL